MLLCTAGSDSHFKEKDKLTLELLGVDSGCPSSSQIVLPSSLINGVVCAKNALKIYIFFTPTACLLLHVSHRGLYGELVLRVRRKGCSGMSEHIFIPS